jgi:hypothetical protein
MERMRKRDRKALGRYIRWCADAMELRDWTIELMHDPCEPDCNASVEIVYGRKFARVFVNQDFRAYDPERQRHTIVHELVHLHLESACSMVRNDLEHYLPRPVDHVFWEGYKRQVEYGVDALASAIAKHLPLVEWPDA